MIYNRFFGLNKRPFSLTPDPETFFVNGRLREALAGITYAILHKKGLLVLTGEAGTGKTTLLARVLRYLPTNQVQTCLILNPTLTIPEFLEAVLLDFGIPDIPESKTRRLQRLQELLLRNHEAGKISVMIVDEAHKLPLEILEEIRLFGNFENPEQKLLQVLLAGQPELSGVLNRDDMRQFKQRIAVRLHIEKLEKGEVELYIRHRWKEAGGEEPIPFSKEALEAIVTWSNGIPRLVNSICDNALLGAFADESRQVLASHVREAAEDLDLVPAFVQPQAPPETRPADIVVTAPAAPTSPVSVIAPFRVADSHKAVDNGNGSKSWWDRWAERVRSRN